MTVVTRSFAFSRFFRFVFAALALLAAAQLGASSAAQAEIVQQTNKLVGTGSSPSSAQGFASAMSGDGTTAIVGDYNDTGGEGAAWIYIRSGATWSQQDGKLVGTGAITTDASQGWSVAISHDGNTVALGAPGDNGSFGSGVGAVWIFVRDNMGNWSQQQKLIGSGAVGNSWQGYSVALSRDGNTVMFGGPQDDGNKGAAWVFTRTGTTWTQQGPKLRVVDGYANSGEAVALSVDGNTALIGGNSGSAAFVRSGGAWSQQSNTWSTSLATSAALSDDGNTAALGDPYGGYVVVFNRSGGVWSDDFFDAFIQPNDATGSFPQVGQSVSLSADGNTLVFGAPYDANGIGAFWVFTRSGTNWTQLGSKIVAPPDADDFADNGIILFGNSVGISADGNRIIAGAHGNYDAATDIPGAVWMFVQTPSITSVSPNSGPTAGGNTVTITGSGFTGVNAVTIGGNTVSATVVNPAHITFTAPAHAAGAVDIDIDNGISLTTSIGAYTYVASPTVTGVSPGAGPAAGGTQVIITGTNLTGATAVMFGATAAASFSVDSATQITATTPAHSAGAVDVTVTAPGGTSAAGIQFLFSGGPTLTGLNPNTGYVTGGQSVSIAGTNLTGATSVSFGGSNATNFTVNSATQITAVAPARAAGMVNVIVTTPAGTTVASAASQFTYRAAPATSSLYKFRGGTADGANPTGWLVQDRAGNLYGVTSSGGRANAGTVFMMTRPAGSATAWRRTVLHSFGQAKDGNTPIAGLFIDKAGKLYGSTNRGGAANRGMIFRLTPPASASKPWAYQELYSFKSPNDGYGPRSVVVDDDGTLYGTTIDGGAERGGILFKLSPAAGNKPWVKKTLHAFSGADGDYPVGRLTFDASGDLVGTTQSGGTNEGGVVYRFTPPAGNAAPKRPVVLFRFKTSQAYRPMSGGVVIGDDGEIFGATFSSAGPNLGAIYKLEPLNPAETRYRDTVLFRFDGENGALPTHGLVMDRQGALLGSTYGGGGRDGAGLVFKLSPPTGNQTAWTQQILRTFGVSDPAGNSPSSDLLIGKGNVIYGINEAGGGPCNCGAVFMIKE